MSYKNKNSMRYRFLVRLLAIVMAISMMPYQALATAHAAQPGSVTSTEESADQSGDAQDNNVVEEPDKGQVQEDVDQQDDSTVETKPASKDAEKDADVSAPVKKNAKTTPPVVDSSDGKKDATKAAGLSPEEQADENYGPNGKAKTFKVALTDDKDTAEAGDMIKYNIDVTMYQAAFYKYDGQNQEPMFTQWENITVKVKLPQVTIPGTGEVRQVRITGTTDADIDSYSQIDAANNIWEIVLKKNTRDATNSNSVNLDINTRISGNGELPDGTVLPEAEVTFSADFYVRIDEDESVPPKKYSKTVTDTTETIALSTPDEWMLTKSPYDGEKAYTISKKDGTVTIHYLVKYGLKVGEGQSAVPTEDKNVYIRNGRAPFAGDIQLTDTPELTLHDGSTLAAQAITVTPSETGYIYKDGTSADEGNQPKPINVQSGQPVNLPYAVVGQNNNEVAENAPAFSSYNVDMVYDYSQFMVWYYENAAKTTADSSNVAKIDYQILGQNAKDTQDDGTTEVPAYIEPGHITIEKYIVNYDDDQKMLYTSSVKAPVTGPATFKVFEDDGTTPAKIYYKDSSNKYHEISGNTVTIDPGAAASNTNGNDGKVAFYLDAGTYIIQETGTPARTEAVGDNPKTVTVNEDGEAKAAFNNKEKLGEVKVHKTDDSNNALPVPGAVFGLYQDRQHTTLIEQKETNGSGNAIFKRLAPGTYYLWEISAPEGYIKSDEVKEVTVTANNTTEEAVQVKNRLNKTVIKLQKQYSTVNDPTNFKDVKDDYRAFEKAFTLQSSIDGQTWINVTDQRYSLDNNGSASVQVAKVDDQDRKLMYRFVEVVPKGYYGPAGEKENQTVTSDSITPANGQDTIVMKNLKSGFIELTKKKVVVNESSGTYTPQNQSGKEFKLYRKAEGSPTAEEVDGATATTGSDGKCKFSDLLSINPDGKKYTYYVVEQNPDEGYTWITDTTISIDGNRTPAVTVGSFQDGTSSTLTPVSYNVEQRIVIGIIKKDKLTDTQLANAKFEVSDGTKVKTVTSSASAAARLPIELGKVYTITETQVPTGYYKDSEESPVTLDTRGWKVGMKNDGSFAVYDADGHEVTSDALTFTFKDTPQKKIRVTKKVKKVDAADTTATALSGVTFSIYTRNGDNFEAYKVDGNPVTIKADGTSAVSLPTGVYPRDEYWLHEDTKLDTVVYPDQHPELYQGKGQASGGKFYFGPYKVTKPEDRQDINWDVDVINIYNRGDLIVKKRLFDTENNEVTTPGSLSGFRMEVYRAGVDGKPTGSRVTYANTANGGQATFRNLPVYDSNGQLISYVIKEVYTGNQADYYYTADFLSSKHPEMILGGEADAGFVANHQYLSVDVVKMYYDAREYELTGLKYELEGAVIALYRNNGDGTYTYLGKGTTNKDGEVSFGKLEYSADGFVAIEVSVPDRPEYKYMVPVQGKYLDTDAQGNCPESLTEEQVSGLSKAALVSTTTPKYTGEIDNVIPWTQIHVTKKDEYTGEKLDGANFTLYKQVLPEGTTEGELTFDASNCTVVGEYTSGTWIHEDEPQKGEFQTDILEYAKNIVYWLVETKAPTGYSIIPSENHVLFTAEETNYTNNTSGKVYKQEDGDIGLEINKINPHTVLDHPLQGPGDGTENWAFIEFNKWMQKESTVNKPRKDLVRSDFTLMPNATFKLFAVKVDKDNHSNDQEVLLLDTITTGDENVVDGSATTGYGVSRSMDAWAIFNTLEKMYPDTWDQVITYHSSPDSGYDVTYPYVVGPDGKPIEDAQGHRTRIKGTFTLNAVLVEVSSSSKYELDLHKHNMQITFVPSSLYLGNDKYAVPDIEKTGDYGGYSSDLCDNEGRRLDYTDNDHQSMAIVDYLAVDNSVVLRHFGYDPEKVGYNKLHEDLEGIHDDNPSLFVSKEVTFRLEKFNTTTNKWEAWDPKNNRKLDSGTGSFKTDGDGYHFDKGLDPGEYKVVMTTPASGYENFYPNNNLAFHFNVVVSDRTQTFTTYSPSKPKMTITKTDRSGRAISQQAEFKLVNKTGTEYSKTVKTNSDGEAVFTELPADTTFTLSETKGPDGFTNEYFKQLFIAQNQDFADLVNGNGYPVSYTTTTRPNGTSSLDGSKLHEKVIEEKDYNKAFAFKAPNIETVKVKLEKKDAQKGTPLKGAVFAVYYHAFDKISGSYTVPEYSGTDPAWISLGTVTSGDDGTVTITDSTFANKKIHPGVYYIVETKAPAHYDLPDPDAQTIVMTGGLDLQIAESDKYTVYRAAGGTGQLTFEDMPKVKMQIDKTVDFGKIPARDYSFEFELLDSEGKIVPGNPAKATGKAAGGVIPEANKTKAVFEDLSQGATYYLKEKTAAGYLLQSVKVGNRKLDPETSGDFKGYYKIVIPKDGTDVSVDVTNLLLEARVTIFKYDGETGEGLTGASFEVLKSDEETPISGAKVTDNGDGSYTAVIPFEKNEQQTIFIHEVKAPEKDGKRYTIDEANASIKVEDLKPGDNKTYVFDFHNPDDNVYTLPNYEGTSVKIHKYGGVHDDSEHVDVAGAQFQMYFSTDGGKTWDTWHPAETTDAQGQAEFLVLPGYDYALAEINDVKGYVELEGIFDGSKKLDTKTSSDGRTLYLLDIDWNEHEAGQEYTFDGYNIPYLKLIVNKEDISGKVQNPNVDFHVYEVPNGTPTTLTEEQITALTDNSKKNIEDRTENSTYTNDQFIRPGRTYLAVEDHAIATGTEYDDYSIIKDDSRVVSYEVFSVPAKNYEKEYSVTFKNNKGDASIELEKTVDKERIDSLTVKEAELKYTLKPTTTNGYALDAYKLNDSGLTATPGNATLADEWYNITEVIVGQGSMDHYLKGAKKDKDYVIKATVTFVAFDGTEYKMNPVNVSEGNITVVPTGTDGKKIKSFYVEYDSPDLKADTGYALGQNFVAGATVATATVFKQEKPAQGVVTSVTKIRDDADVMLKYTPWSSTGEKEKQKTLTAEDYAETLVDSAKAPKIQFTKDGPPTNTPVELGTPITYKLTIDNITGEPIVFTDPIIVDLLPQGIVVDQGEEFVKVTDKPNTISDNPTVTTGYAGDSEYVNIAFSGTVGDGESIEVELRAHITDGVTNYGSTMRNFAFTTSKEVGVATNDNTTGAVIKDDEGLWASELVSIAKALGCPEERAQALKTALGTQGTYGYLGDFHENFWITDNQLVCVKAEYGPSDGGVYRTDKVALLTNDEHDDAQRTMHYQLTINNVSEAKRTNMAVMDIMPAVGDQRINNTGRGSNWDLYFDKMGTVKVNGEKCTNYSVYYYSGDATQFDADAITDIVNESKQGCPAGWSTSKPDKPTAFIVAFAYDPTDKTAVTDAKTVVLEGNKSVQIEYTAKIDYLKNPEDLNKIVFTNAANDFNFGYSTFSPPSTADQAKPYEPLGSNVVEVTITPPKVKVGGDVWIDADSDGWQNDGDQSWYLGFAVVKQLLNDLSVKLNTSNQRNFAITEETQGTITQTGSDPDNYGIAHFEFDELTAAKLRSGSTDLDDLKNWINDKAGDEAGKLIGKNPYTYNMDMSYKGSTFTKTKNNVDPRGSYVPGNIPEDDQKDDNFENRRGDYQTEQFFLHQTTDIFDMTKDNGYNLPRSLELTKVSQSTGEALEGAEFTIYGPFDHDKNVTDADLTDDNIVDTLTTDADGKASKTGLFFFKKYVIVETKPAADHGIEGAKAEGTNITKLGEGKWLLNVPDADYVPSGDEITDQVIVRDPGNIEVEVEKIWDDDEDAYGTRPESIKTMLYTDEDCTIEAKYADGATVESKELNDANGWKAKWDNLPRYKSGQGGEATEITYYVKETDSSGAPLNGYNVTIKSDKDESTGNQKLTITNTPISTSLEVKKNWEDTDDLAAKVTAVTFRVEQSTDGENWTPAVVKGQEITLTIERKQGEKMGTVTKDGLPAYDENNKPLTYRAVEISITIDGKTLEVKDGKVGPYEVTETHTPGKDESAENATATDLSEITNTMIPTEFSVEKTFVDDTFDLNKGIKSITVMLQRKSGNGGWSDVESFDLTAGSGWKHTWTGLQKLDSEGNAYEYRAVEVSYTTKSGKTVSVSYDNGQKTSGTIGAYVYSSRTEGSEENGYTTYIENELLKGSLEVKKLWKGNDKAKEPESLTIILKAVANGKEINLKGVKKSTVLNKSNNWSDDTTWAELPVYYVDGSKIGYLLTESGKGKYKAEYKVHYDGSVIKKGSGKTLTVNVYANDTVKAEFINTLPPPPNKTGDNMPLLPFLLLSQLSLAGLLILFLRRRRSA